MIKQFNNRIPLLIKKSLATRKPLILFIGFGHLAKSLLSPKFIKNYNIHYINSKNNILSLKDKKKVTKQSLDYKYIFLLVRPDVFKKIGNSFQSFINKDSVVISCMAGVSVNSISQKLNNTNIIRIMPNVMAKNSLSQTFVYSKNKKILDRNLNYLLSTFGSVLYANNEDDLNVATAIFGSGPAFIAYIINSYLLAAKNLSSKFKIKDDELINLFHNVISSNDNSKDLENFVLSIASKKGTTQAGVKFLKSQNIKKMIYSTLDRAYKRAKEISIEKKRSK